MHDEDYDAEDEEDVNNCGGIAMNHDDADDENEEEEDDRLVDVDIKKIIQCNNKCKMMKR